MPTPVNTSRSTSARARRVHLALRDGTALNGRVFLADGQALALYLGSRKGGWVNVIDAAWAADGEAISHLVVQADHLALAASVDGDIAGAATPAAVVPRWVQLSLENGDKLHGCLFLGERQRLSDYLYAVGRFLPITSATRASDGATWDDVAVNSATVRLVRDVGVPAASERADAAAADAAYAVFLIDDTAVTRQRLSTDVASLTLLTPGRFPDRRALDYAPRLSVTTPPALAAELVPLTPEQELGVARAAHHWLTQMTARRGMAPPVGRLLNAAPSTAELWNAVCAANDMAEEELAAIVSAEYQLPTAVLASVDPKAVAVVPGPVARQLNVLPLAIDEGSLRIATTDPRNDTLEQQLRFVTRRKIVLEIAPPSRIAMALDWWYPGDAAAG